MIQVWLYDENYIFIESIFTNAIEENMTTVPLSIGYIKPTFNGEEWVEGATKEEIQKWEEDNAPQPTPPTEIEILQEQLMESYMAQAELYEMIIALEEKIGGTK